jgi:hypothetical protein
MGDGVSSVVNTLSNARKSMVQPKGAHLLRQSAATEMLNSMPSDHAGLPGGE